MQGRLVARKVSVHLSVCLSGFPQTWKTCNCRGIL